MEILDKSAKNPAGNITAITGLEITGHDELGNARITRFLELLSSSECSDVGDIQSAAEQAGVTPEEIESYLDYVAKLSGPRRRK